MNEIGETAITPNAFAHAATKAQVKVRQCPSKKVSHAVPKQTQNISTAKAPTPTPPPSHETSGSCPRTHATTAQPSMKTPVNAPIPTSAINL